ncbi:MAG TPA: hypothetical protein VK425_00900 [Acidimicrobiales bacterium]|nr:hypothetical protein [Acidimicrobiales bacterium]
MSAALDETTLVAVGGTRPEMGPGEPVPFAIDPNFADWAAAQARHADMGPPASNNRPEEELSLAPELLGPGEPAPLLELTPLELTSQVPAWKRKHRTALWLRLWALAKMAAMVWTAEWALGELHEKLAPGLCAYGAVCLFAGFGARWRRRFFGPGQLLEPEFYEVIGLWLYRAGVALVIAGGALMVAQQLAA